MLKNNTMIFSNASVSIATIINNINREKYGGLDVRPSYQRGYVWNNDFKEKLIYSIIKNYPIGNITIRVLDEKNEKGAMQEVVDGQQRLLTIKNFVDDKKGESFYIKGKYAKKIVMYIEDYFKSAGEEYPDINKLLKKNKLRFSDLPDIIKSNIYAFNIATVQISKSSEEQIREYFRFLQNQERLRAGEIIKSMPATNLEDIMSKITDKISFLETIGFIDDRAEFDKIFYSIVGLFDRKINFGLTDKQIQEYAFNAEQPTEGLEYVNRLVTQINKIIKIFDGKKIVINTRKRYLKYLLLLMGFGYVDFSENAEIKLKKLYEIDNKLSAFFSAKADALEKKYVNYPSDIIEELRLVALISKGGHTYSRVDNRIKILAHYINNYSDEKPSYLKVIDK